MKPHPIWKAIYRRARARGMGPHDAEEIAGEVQARMAEQATRTGPPRTPKPYALRIARRIIRERKHQAATEPEPEDIDATEPQPATPNPNPRDLAADAEERNRALSHLPPQLRVIIDMALEGYTQQEIACTLGLTRQAVDHRQRRALLILDGHHHQPPIDTPAQPGIESDNR